MESSIGIDFNPIIVQQLRAGESRVTWAAQDPSGLLFRGQFATFDDYLCWISKRGYSVLLFDGAFLQFTYDYAGEDMIGHRLLYYPCPYDIDDSLLADEPLLDVLEVYRTCVEVEPRLRSPLRFDYDPQAARDGHSASHLTIFENHCRWPVVSPLGPGHFIKFVFQQFYPNLWQSFEFIRTWPQALGPTTISRTESRLLHIGCAREFPEDSPG